MNKISFILITLVAIGIISCKGEKTKKKERPPVVVDVMIAEKVNFPTTVEVNGSALCEEMIELRPEVNGRLIYLNIPDGATVAKGTILAKINDAELQAQLQQQNVQLDLAKKTEQRLNKLLAINGVNQAEYDAALNQVNSIEANINILNAKIDQTVIKAPFGGKLGLRMVSPGAYVTPQTILGTLQQTDNIKIDFTVPESYSNLVKTGNTVMIETNDSDKLRSAVISAVEPQINVDSRNIKVRARLNEGHITPGAFVKVMLKIDGDRILIPSNAIIPDAASNQLVVIKNGKSVFTNVETGIRDENIVEILSGINAGDTVVTSGVLFVRPNSIVNIRDVKKQASTTTETGNKDK
jgi:membrane fusion protein, multidrug efflux system